MRVRASLIAVLRDKANHIRSTLYPTLVEEIIRRARPTELPKPVPGMAEDAAVPPKPTQFVKRQDIKLSFVKSVLSKESDVDAYVEEIRAALLAQIRAGKEIIV